jgi:hypothetical protein
MKFVIPNISIRANFAFLGDWIPVFWFIASDAELSCNEISIRTTALIFIGSEVISWDRGLTMSSQGGNIAYDEEGN